MGSMLLKVICGIMFLLGMSWNVMAKEVIKGRVVDSQSKEVLIGATVSEEGTSVGCATDAEGYFELEVEESGTVVLVFRSVGYSEVKKSVVVGNKKERAEAPMAYDCNKTHLLVLKVDYTKNEVSLFVDPELGQSEPKANIVVTGEEGALKAGLKSVALRNRNGFKGNIGNFRLAKDWAGDIGK